MSTRYTNAVANDTFNPPFTFKKEDGSEGVAIPPHVSRASMRLNYDSRHRQDRIIFNLLTNS